jgi:N-methylhydantoinase B
VPRAASGGRDVTVLQPMFGGGGATARSDGVSGSDSAAGFLRNTPVESMETHAPVLAERYELIPDSAGAGAQRGGFGTRFDFRILRPRSIVTARGMERTRFEPWGLAGGRASNLTRALLDPGGGAERELGRIGVLRLEPGALVSIRGAGGGGYGDPHTRDPQAVLADVRAGLLAAAQAAAQYGVVVESGTLDVSATASLRAQRVAGAAPAATAIDLGPARRAYEQRWPEPASAALAGLLLELPHGLRGFAKQEVHRRVDEEPPALLDEPTLRRLLADVLAAL